MSKGLRLCVGLLCVVDMCFNVASGGLVLALGFAFGRVVFMFFWFIFSDCRGFVFWL